MRAIGIRLGVLWLCCAGLAAAQDAGEADADQPNPFAELKWIVGPTDVPVGTHATLGGDTRQDALIQAILTDCEGRS